MQKFELALGLVTILPLSILRGADAPTRPGILGVAHMAQIAFIKINAYQDYLEFMLHGPVLDASKNGTKNHICLMVKDCRRASEILKARPASKDFKSEEVKVGVNRKRQQNLFDSDGTRVEIMEADTIDGFPTPPSGNPPPIK